MIILYKDKELKQKAEQLGEQLNLPVKSLANFTPSSFDHPIKFAVVLTEERLEIRQFNISTGPFFIDFTNESLDFRVRHSGRKNEALARAVGLKKNRTPIIFDLTAGLGRDAFILASLGCQVQLFERNIIISALLEDGLKRATQSKLLSVINLMTLHHGDSINLLEKKAKTIKPDVIYLDPMFPHRTKSALVKKEMRIIREIVGDDQDSDLLFKQAIKYASKRVVCKRPRQAPFLGLLPPDMQISTKKHRFDVYFP